LLAQTAETTPGKTTEAKPRPPEPETEPGDIYVLGRHRLICGDATDPGALDALLEGAQFDLLYTDPPYGMSYQSFSRKFEVIEGDDLRGDELMALVHDSIALARTHRSAGAASYIWCTWRTYPEFLQALARAEVEPTGCIVWKKGRVGPGNAHYRPEHEFCLYDRPDVDNDHGLCVYCKGETWEGGRGQSDVWEMPRDTGYVHPTQKPIALAEKALTNSTRPGATVLDLFGGSGSTLLACENLNRRGGHVELDAGYCDVIVDRWTRHTGGEPDRIRADG
jgi:DNA modification methylase